jgi:hypothetical protein
MDVRGATPREVEDYRKFAELYRTSVGRAQPIMAAITRRAGRPDWAKSRVAEVKPAAAIRDPDGPPPEPQPPGEEAEKKPAGAKPEGDVETLLIEARVSPFTGNTYRTVASRLGPATKQTILPLPGNLISFNAMVSNGGLTSALPEILRGLGGGGGGDDGYRMLFGGVSDFRSPVSPGGGFLESLQTMRQTNAYAGSYPEAGLLGRILGLDKPLPEGEIGYREVLGLVGLWGMKLNDFSIVIEWPRFGLRRAT